MSHSGHFLYLILIQLLYLIELLTYIVIIEKPVNLWK